MRSDDFDPQVRIFAEQPDGTWRPLGEDGDDGMGTDSRIRLALPYSGRYRIHATAYRVEARGEYALSAEY